MKFRIRSVQPLYVHIATLFFFLFLVIGFIQVFLAYRQSYNENYTYGRELFNRQGTEVEQALRLQLQPVQKSLQLLSYTPAASRSSLGEYLHSIPQFAEVLRGNPAVSAIYIGFHNGDFLLLRKLSEAARQTLEKPPPSKAIFMVQTMDSTRRGRVGAFLFLDSALRLLERRPQPKYQYDPRTRIWFQEALKSTGVIMSRPYLFFTTKETGTTLAITANHGRSVIGADLSIAELSQLLANMPHPNNSELILSDDQGQLIASARQFSSKDQQKSLLFLDSLGIPILSQLQNALSEQPLPFGKSRDLSLRTATQERWFGHVVSLSAGNQNLFYLSLLIPNETFVQAASQKALSAIRLALIAMLFMFPCIFLVAKRTAKPLHLLRDEVESILHFNFSSGCRIHSRIREIDDLGGGR